jgi:catechol 2,3-dioxygenase-like lactoylglutathione lyase family enzyme
MLGNAKVMATIAVNDQEAAKRFYGGTLGLQIQEPEMPDGTTFECGSGTIIFVYPSSYAGTNQATTASWEVDDLDAEMDDLRSRGITFEQYDLPYATREGDVHSIADGMLRTAWFKDPDGNILNVFARGS